MTKRALNTHTRQRLSVIREKAFYSNNGLGLEQREGVGGIGEINLSSTDTFSHLLRHGIDIHFETEFECFFRANTRSYTAELFSHDGLVELERSSPERLAAQGVMPENLLAVLQQFLGETINHILEGFAAGLRQKRRGSRA